MDYKFKKGDRVISNRIIIDSGFVVPKGAVGKVIHIFMPELDLFPYFVAWDDNSLPETICQEEELDYAK